MHCVEALKPNYDLVQNYVTSRSYIRQPNLDKKNTQAACYLIQQIGFYKLIIIKLITYNNNVHFIDHLDLIPVITCKYSLIKNNNIACMSISSNVCVFLSYSSQKSCKLLYIQTKSSVVD